MAQDCDFLGDSGSRQLDTRGRGGGIDVSVATGRELVRWHVTFEESLTINTHP